MSRAGWIAVWMVIGLNCSVWAAQGPLPTQIRFPLHLLFLTPRPVSAELPPKGSLELGVSLDFSRVNLYQASERWTINQDMEMTVAEISLGYAVTKRTAVRLILPVASMNSGFLDHFVNEYHEMLGIHSVVPDNLFAYEASKDGQVWLKGASGRVELADVTLSAQWEWLPSVSHDGFCSSLMASVKLPTGSPRRGYGSGRTDIGFFLPSQWSGRQWSFYLMPGYIWPSDPDTDNVKVGARQSMSLFAGTSYAYNERWQWLLQFDYFESLLEHTGIEAIDDGALEMTFGLRYRTGGNWAYEVGFSEDIFTIAAPDFTVHMGVVWLWRTGQGGA